MKSAPEYAAVRMGQVLTFEEECNLEELWGEENRRQHLGRSAGAHYIELDGGILLEVIHEEGDPLWGC